MNCGESSSADVETFFWSSPDFSEKNVALRARKPSFFGPYLFSVERDVKALWGQFRPILSEKGRLCRKGLKYQVACQKKPAACHIWHACHRFATPAVGGCGVLKPLTSAFLDILWVLLPKGAEKLHNFRFSFQPFQKISLSSSPPRNKSVMPWK